MPDHDLELALAGCGRELAFPPTPDLVSAVARRLEAVQRPRRTRRRMLVLAFALLLATAGVAAGVTAGLRGLGIAFVHKLPPVTPGAGLNLGLQVQQGEAQKLAGFRVLVPGPPLGRPDAWFVGNIDQSRLVTLVWTPAKGLPPARHGISVLVTETQGSVDPTFVKKLVGTGTRVDSITVNGAPGLWISGNPHVIIWSDRGAFRQQIVRLVGDVIVWNQGGLLLRIEGARSRAEALRLARSFS